MSFPCPKGLAILAALACSLTSHAPSETSLASPVEQDVPVTFPVPPSTEVLRRTDGQFQVTFRWKPGGTGIQKPGIAGSFNKWSRIDNPMEGPDRDGFYTVTLTLPEGEHQYKFIGGDNSWYVDPQNPWRDTGYDNSVLRLGLAAEIFGKIGTRGDGKIDPRALTHDPSVFTYFDAINRNDIMLRVRTLKDDVESVDLVLTRGGAEIERVPMGFAASDTSFDFYEHHVVLPSGANRPDGYRIIARDGAAESDLGQAFPLRVDTRTIVHTPQWAREAIWYQVVIDRFRDGDPTNNPEHTPGTGRVAHTSRWTHDQMQVQEWERQGDRDVFNVDADGSTTPDIYERLYGGDFQGFIDKLDYLKELGVTAIYFNPIFESTSHHKYNGKTYVHADDGYGMPGEFARSNTRENLVDPVSWEFNQSDEKFLELLRETKSRGFRVIIDGVFNHLGNDSTAFLDVAKHGRESPVAGWFDVVTWEPFEVRGWAGFGGLPEFRKDPVHGLADESLRLYIHEATRRWQDPDGDGNPADGIDGWRLDVPMLVPRPFWVEWRNTVKSTNPEAYIVGEVWDPAEEWLDGKTYDAVMNYQFRLAVLKFFGNKEKRTTATEFDRELARLRIRYPRAATYVLQNLVDSHDTDRIASRLMNPDLDGDPHYDGRNRLQDTNPDYNNGQPTEEAYRQLKLLALFQTTYVGAPMIYYGTEVGMWGADDPICRNPMWWEDLMPYDNPDYVIRKDVFQHYQRLFEIRRNHPVLSHGDYRTLLAEDDREVFAFLRYSPLHDEAILVVANNNAGEQKVSIKSPGGKVLPNGFGGALALMGDISMDEGDGGARLDLRIPQASGAIIRIPTRTGEAR